MICNSAVEEGTETALKLGFEIGENRGESRGRKQGIIETAINMLNKGLDKKTISECTGLSIKEIEKVAL